MGGGKKRIWAAHKGRAGGMCTRAHEGGLEGRGKQTHLPVLAFTAPGSRLKLGRGHDLMSLGYDAEVLAALPQLQPPRQLLADDPNL